MANGTGKPSSLSAAVGVCDACSRLSVTRCIRLPGSAFGAYYHRLVAQGKKKRDAMMAVMRKMLIVAYRLLRTGEMYDPTKVGVGTGGSGAAAALRVS